MGPLSYMLSVVDRNVVMRRIPVYSGRVYIRYISFWSGQELMVVSC